jgi:hypothetical protein
MLSLLPVTRVLEFWTFAPFMVRQFACPEYHQSAFESREVGQNKFFASLGQCIDWYGHAYLKGCFAADFFSKYRRSTCTSNIRFGYLLHISPFG